MALATTATSAGALAAPSLHVAAPLDDTVARPIAHVELACDDDGAPCTVVSLVERDDGAEPRLPIATWRDVRQAALDLPIADGVIADLELHATGADGTSTTVIRRVHGDASPALHELVTVDGRIADADLDRVLYERDGRVWIAHRDGCALDDLGPGAAQALTSRGALTASCSGGACTLVEWRDGARVDRGAVAPSSLRTAGDFAVWSEGYVPGPLHRLDLAAGTDLVIATTATPGSGAVGDGGVVTYSIPQPGGTHVAHQWSAGVDTTLGPGDLSVAGGALAIFADDDAPACTLRLYDGRRGFADEQLAPLCTPASYLATVRGDRVAFVRPDSDGVRQLWMRSPAGELTQLTTTGVTLAPPLADDGTMLPWTTIDGVAGRYLLGCGAAPRFVTRSQAGPIRAVSGHWLIAIGRTLFTSDDAAPAAVACASPPTAPVVDDTAAAAETPPMSSDAQVAGCAAGGGAGGWPFALAIALLVTARAGSPGRRTDRDRRSPSRGCASGRRRP